MTDTEIVFLETKNGRSRRIPLSPAIRAMLEPLPRVRPWVFTNAHTGKPFTTVGKNFERLGRAGIRTGDVSFHTLRHTALSRMIAEGAFGSHRSGDQRTQHDPNVGAVHPSDGTA